MFSEPTINDFLDNVKWHLAKAADRAGRAVASTQGLLASKGGLNSGRAIIMIFDAVRTEFDAAIDTVFGELKRTINRTHLNRGDLRQAAVSCLENFAIEMKALTNADQYRSLAAQAVDERLTAMDRHLAFAIRQFDTGFIDPSEPERPNVNNSINIGTMTGSAIQHGSPGATQSIQFNLKIDEARSALAAFESAMQTVQLSRSQSDEVIARCSYALPVHRLAATDRRRSANKGAGAPPLSIQAIISAYSSGWTGGALEAVMVADGRAGAAAWGVA
jgi:hypothetical protein